MLTPEPPPDGIEARMGYRLTIEVSAAPKACHPRLVAIAWAVAALHSCSPTRSASEFRMASMHRARLSPPWTQMLKLITLSSVTEAALNCQTKLSPANHGNETRDGRPDDRAGRWRGRLGGNNGQIMLHYAQRSRTCARARIRTSDRAQRSTTPLRPDQQCFVLVAQ